MILCNSFIYLVAHLPEFISTILLVVYSKKIEHFCNDKISCDQINEEAEFFSLISIVGQFYIFLSFNKCFRASLKEFFNRISYFNVSDKKLDTSIMVTNIELKNLKNLIGDGKIN